MGSDGEDTPPSRQPRSLFDWFFRNRVTDEITIAQFPNAALWVFLGATVARRIVEKSRPLGRVFGWVALAALLIWAVDEVLRGVNPWRRVLGAAVLAYGLRATCDAFP
jgi:hypothetical protein